MQNLSNNFMDSDKPTGGDLILLGNVEIEDKFGIV